MPHKSGYGNDKKMPKNKGDSYSGGYEGGMPVTESSDQYFRPMDSYPNKKNPHEY